MAIVVAETPLALYDQLKTHDFTPVKRTLQEDSGFSEEKTNTMLDAFLQWFALVPFTEANHVYVMLKTDVDEVFHAAVLNTAWYREFCQQYVGDFVDHNPLDPRTRDQLGDAVWETIDRLDMVYGKQLHPALQEWRPLVASGTYVVSCGCCPDDAPMTSTIVGHLPNGARIVH